MNYTIPMLALLMVSCAVVEKEITDTADLSDSFSQTDTAAPPEMSECGQQVLEDDSWAYSSCFGGDEMYGACETCGYYPYSSESQGAYDCITCEEGYAIDVVFNDCTGYCVPYGALHANPAPDFCNAISECVYEE